MDAPGRLCEIFRHDDASALGDVANALEARGVPADVLPVKERRLTPWSARAWRLVVSCRQIVYARWVAAEAGLDTWPDEDAAESAEESPGQAARAPGDGRA